jgi:hypothetical protein
MTSTLQKIPGIGDIPILGQLFKSKAAQKNQTELVVMITPQILLRSSSGVTPNLPRQVEPYLPTVPQKKSFDPPPPAFRPGGSQEPTPQPAAGTPASSAPATSTGRVSPADAARAVSALTAGGPKRMDAPAAEAPASPAAVPATPESSAASASADTAPETPSTTRPLTASELKVLERARSQERDQAAADSRARAADTKRMQKQLADDAYKASKEKDRQDKLAREQAKRDAAAAKKQAEIDRKYQKAIEEAQAKLKAAEAAYQAKSPK